MSLLVSLLGALLGALLVSASASSSDPVAESYKRKVFDESVSTFHLAVPVPVPVPVTVTVTVPGPRQRPRNHASHWSRYRCTLIPFPHSWPGSGS